MKKNDVKCRLQNKTEIGRVINRFRVRGIWTWFVNHHYSRSFFTHVRYLCHFYVRLCAFYTGSLLRNHAPSSPSWSSATNKTKANRTGAPFLILWLNKRRNKLLQEFINVLMLVFLEFEIKLISCPPNNILNLHYLSSNVRLLIIMINTRWWSYYL